mgnify:CR=1 FL=1
MVQWHCLPLFELHHDNIHCVTASKSIHNIVTEIEDPVDSIPILYPERKRLVPIKGDTDIAIGEDVSDGIETIFKENEIEILPMKSKKDIL